MALQSLQRFWQLLEQDNLSGLGHWHYILLAVLVALEGPSITILGAILASRGAMRPEWVFVAASIGNASADIGWYALGYLGRFEVLTKRIRWLQKYQAALNNLEQQMRQHAVKLLLIAKLTLSLVIPTLIAAGMARIPWRRWLPVVFLGECIWTGGLVLAGYYLGDQIKQFELTIQLIAIAGVLIFVGILIWTIKRATSPPTL